jgi:hypothetical protein
MFLCANFSHGYRQYAKFLQDKKVTSYNTLYHTRLQNSVLYEQFSTNSAISMAFVSTTEAVGTKTPLHTERLNNFKSEFYVNIVQSGEKCVRAESFTDSTLTLGHVW